MDQPNEGSRATEPIANASFVETRSNEATCQVNGGTNCLDTEHESELRDYSCTCIPNHVTPADTEVESAGVVRVGGQPDYVHYIAKGELAKANLCCSPPLQELSRDGSPQSDSVSSTIDGTEDNDDTTNTPETGKQARRRRKRRKNKMGNVVEDAVPTPEDNVSELNVVGARVKPDNAVHAANVLLTPNGDLNATNPVNKHTQIQINGSARNDKHHLQNGTPSTVLNETPSERSHHESCSIVTEDRTSEINTEKQPLCPTVHTDETPMVPTKAPTCQLQLPELRRVESPQSEPVSSATEITDDNAGTKDKDVTQELQQSQAAKKKRKRHKKKRVDDEDTESKADDDSKLHVTAASMNPINSTPSAVSTTALPSITDASHTASSKETPQETATSIGLTFTQPCEIPHVRGTCEATTCQNGTTAVDDGLPPSKPADKQVINKGVAASNGTSDNKKGKRKQTKSSGPADQRPVKNGHSAAAQMEKSPLIEQRYQRTVESEDRISAVDLEKQPTNQQVSDRKVEVPIKVQLDEKPAQYKAQLTTTATHEQTINENEQGVQPTDTKKKSKVRKNRSKSRNAIAPVKDVNENTVSDSLSQSASRQVKETSTDVRQENKTDIARKPTPPLSTETHTKINCNADDERRRGGRAAGSSDVQQGKPPGVPLGDTPEIETIYEAPYNTQRETDNSTETPHAEYKMAASICHLIQESLNAKESKDLKKAKQMALQAMLGATEAKEEFLKGSSSGLAAQPLADWFGQCALILHETKTFISALNCFYTATVFDGFWDIEDHVRVSRTLWDNILNQTSLVKTQTEKVYEILQKVYEVAVLALARCLYHLCSRICTEVDSIYGLLVKKFRVCKLEKYHTDIKPVFLCGARAHYQTGDYVVASAMCAAILQEMCAFDCSEAFELWGMVLLKEKNFERAAAKFQMALKHAKGQERETKLAMKLKDVCQNYKIVLGDEERSETRRQQYRNDPPQSHDTGSQSRGPRFGNTHAEPEAGTSRSRNFYTESQGVEDDDTPQLPYHGRPDHHQASREDQEVTTFYEQSRRIYAGEDRPLRGETSESNYQQMLESGVTLNQSYMQQFADKHDTQYNRDPYYAEYKSEEDLRRLLTNRNKFLRCELQIESAHVAFCKPLDHASGIELIEIAGRSKAGQAFNGDEVVVDLLDNRHDDTGKRFGQIIGILKRTRYRYIDHPVFLCTLDDMQSHFVRPVCKTVPKISVLNQVIWQNYRKLKKYKVEVYKYDKTSETIGDPEVFDINLGDLQKYVFMVVYINWTPRKIYPRGAIIRMLDYGDTLTSGLTLLNLRHSVPSLYGRPVVETIQQNGLDIFDDIQPEDYYGREDLRDLSIFTIDPEGSKDLDDALSIEHLSNGYRVGIHIADVSQFVLKDDAVDEEAQQRATTFYPSIPGKLPRNMLPEPLSSNVCSLLPNKCRLTLSVFFHLSDNGEMLNRNATDVRKTLIRSHERFTYRHVQGIIEGKEHRFQQELTILHDLTSKIRKRRLGNAMFAIDLSNGDDDDASSVGESFEAHYLVEELMIMANEAVARKLMTSFPKCVPLRCQPPPTEESVEKFLEENSKMIDIVVKLQDRKLSRSKTSKLSSLLGTSSNQHDPTMIAVPRHIWNIVNSGKQDVTKVLCTDDIFPLQHLIHQRWIALRKPAEYKCTGAVDHVNSLRHYELEVYPYTHFTSPIRRYIDLVVHRLLHAAIDNDASPYSGDEIERICHHVNTVTTRAKGFQRDCKVLKTAVELKKSPKMLHCYVDDLSDRSISLSSPAMKTVPHNYRQLAFNLLDMGFKPDLNSNTATLNATWKKRLYDVSGVSTQLSDRRGDTKLNSNQGVVFIPIQKWARILKCAMENRMNDLKNALTNSNERPIPSGNADDVSTESMHTETPLKPNTTFSLEFKKGQLLKVQLSAVPLKGILTPRPMLYNMTNNVKLCLQHTDDAVLHLSRYVNRCTLDQYESVEKYLKRWIPLIQMEAATCAVANEESCLISNVKVRFDSENDRAGKFTLLTEYCELRNIDFSGAISEKDGDDTDESAEAYDWLCIRYSIPGPAPKQGSCSVVAKLDSVWVGHAEINGVKKRVDGKTLVRFQLHERCPPVPAEANRKGTKFSVEILRKSEVDRRTESFLKRLRLKDYRNTLANTIALNISPIPPLDKVHLDMARTIERDVQTPRLPPNNRRQQEAINKALKSRMSLIQGPPGTGKTVTGVKLMYLFDKINQMICSETSEERRQILYCGPCNKSVDLVGRLLKEKLGVGALCPKFVRVYGRSIESIEFPIPGRTFLSKKSTRALKADEDLLDVALHHLIRKNDRPYAKEIKNFDQQFKRNNYVASLDDTKDYMALLSKASVEEIKKYGVILCTTAVGSNPKILKAANVFQVLVDEAGMCPEPQCLMPIIATKAEQVVLIGDHKQLRPIIICNQAAELGLQTSLFEKLYLSHTAKSVRLTMLNWQYRMNPMLCAFPSKQFYDDELVTQGSPLWEFDRLANLWPKCGRQWCPHVFLPVYGEERALAVATEEGNENSKSNLAEVNVVMRILRYFIESGIDGEQVNVMSQYNAQCAVIRNAIAEQGFQNCNVSTVVSSQGGEWDYVIFSTVRSLPSYKIERNPTIGWCQQNLGFITDKNQINVALTRARKGLIIIGNPNLLRCDQVFKDLLIRYDQYECIKSPDEFLPKRGSRLQAWQRDGKKEMRRWVVQYNDGKFIPGLPATSFKGDVDNVSTTFDDDDDGGNGRAFSRGKRKVLPTRKPQK